MYTYWPPLIECIIVIEGRENAAVRSKDVGAHVRDRAGVRGTGRYLFIIFTDSIYLYNTSMLGFKEITQLQVSVLADLICNGKCLYHHH